MSRGKAGWLLVVSLGCSLMSGNAQQPAAATPQQTQPPVGASLPDASTERFRANYLLGPGDQILIRANEVEELGERPFRIDGDGYLNLPLLGRLKAGGRTVQQLEEELVRLLRTYVRQPQVIVTVVQFRSEPVFFVGAFKAPGIYPLQGRRTLVEMLSALGGLQPNASRRIKVTRRKEFGPIPLANAVETPDAQGVTVEISLGSLTENVNPAEDIVLQPFDVITVERAELIYVNGEVGRVGSFELNERESMSITQVITQAGGLTRDANPEKARILRPVLNTSRRAALPVNLKRVLEGKDRDLPLMPNDLLYVPRASGWKKTLGRGLLIGMPIVSTLIWVVIR
jgi:polysaccharide export outer membrane protein